MAKQQVYAPFWLEEGNMLSYYLPDGNTMIYMKVPPEAAEGVPRFELTPKGIVKATTDDTDNQYVELLNVKPSGEAFRLFYNEN